jgi:hypothetical protein
VIARKGNAIVSTTEIHFVAARRNLAFREVFSVMDGASAILGSSFDDDSDSVLAKTVSVAAECQRGMAEFELLKPRPIVSPAESNGSGGGLGV